MGGFCFTTPGATRNTTFGESDHRNFFNWGIRTEGGNEIGARRFIQVERYLGKKVMLAKESFSR